VTSTRIFVLEFFEDSADIVHLEPEVIQRRVKTRPPSQNGQADDTVADMPVIGLIEAFRNPLHAKDGFVERRHSLLVLGIECQVSDSSRHDSSSVAAACFFATRIAERENGVNAAITVRRRA
jgi:hypothetical protein